MDENIYDFAIVGGGVSGLSASIYSARYKMKTIILTDSFGGTTASAHKICNYPGFKEITGMELMSKMTDQAKSLGVEISFEKTMDVSKKDDFFVINTDNKTIKAKKVLLAIGKKKRHLGLENEDKFLGKGVHYCATCDGGFYRDKVVGVIGGSDAAVTAALLLADIAKEVTIIYRKDKLKAEPMWLESLKLHENIKVIYNAEVKELIGEDKLKQVKLSDQSTLDLDGLFIEIGSVPNTELIDKLAIEMNDSGEIVVDKEQRTNVSGVFASGDATNTTELKQIVTATSQGAIAAYFAYKDIKSNK